MARHRLSGVTAGWLLMGLAPLCAGTGREAAELNRHAAQLFAAKQFHEAIAELRRSLTIDARQAGPTKLLGLCYQLTSQPEEAERAFRAATQLDPHDAEAWFFLGRICYLRNFFDKAVPALETARRLNPGSPRISEQLGLTFEATGQTGQAVKAYEEAVRLNLEQARPAAGPHLNYGALLYKLNQLGKSEAQLKRARELDPQDWRAYFELGKLYFRKQDLEHAARELEQARKLGAADSDATRRICHLLAQVYFRLGRETEARQALAAMERSAP
jgi:Flp pilus assembly protein TadD